MRGKRASFGEEEVATWRVFASLCLEGMGLLIKWEASRSSQRSEISEVGPCISPPLCDPCKDIPS